MVTWHLHVNFWISFLIFKGYQKYQRKSTCDTTTHQHNALPTNKTTCCACIRVCVFGYFWRSIALQKKKKKLVVLKVQLYCNALLYILQHNNQCFLSMLCSCLGSSEDIKVRAVSSINLHSIPAYFTQKIETHLLCPGSLNHGLQEGWLLAVVQ